VPFVNAVRNAGGELGDQARVPADVVAAFVRVASPVHDHEDRTMGLIRAWPAPR
jgi:hypothetical protein